MRSLRIINGMLLLIVAINAFGGGYYGLSGAKNIPVEWLEGSPFRSYVIPSLFLMVIVGGTCLVSSIVLFANRSSARALSFISGSLLLAWIAVQVLIIGYVSWMQPAIFATGIVIIAIGMLLKNKRGKINNAA